MAMSGCCRTYDSDFVASTKVDWLQTFGVEEDLVRWSAFFLTVPSELLASVAYQFQLEEDSSSGPAVLYQAACARLNDGS